MAWRAEDHFRCIDLHYLAFIHENHAAGGGAGGTGGEGNEAGAAAAGGSEGEDGQPQGIVLIADYLGEPALYNVVEDPEEQTNQFASREHADLIADLVSSGTTLRDNHLRPLRDGDILASQACLIANRSNLKSRPQALAVQLRDTRRVAVEWGLDLDHPAWHGEAGDNHEAFRLWNSAFETLCKKEGWLPPEDRPALLAQAAGETASHAGSILDLLGFDEINPAQASLLAAFENAGA